MLLKVYLPDEFSFHRVGADDTVSGSCPDEFTVAYGRGGAVVLLSLATSSTNLAGGVAGVSATVDPNRLLPIDRFFTQENGIRVKYLELVDFFKTYKLIEGDSEEHN